jgi:hypothetical protein
VPVDPAELDARLQKTLEGKSVRQVTLCTSDLVRVPTAIGLVKPVIAMPHWVMQELSPDELSQIVLHELAHLRRWDDWTNLAQKVVKALLFFHPAVWWIEKKVSLEREMACDDAVIAETASPRAYAECLTRLAERTLVRRSMALAQAALGRIRQTSLRVAQILDVNRPVNAGRAWKPAVPLVTGFAMVCVFVISKAPRLVSFSDAGSSAVERAAVASFSVDAGSGHASAIPSANLHAVQATFQRQPVRAVPTGLKSRASHPSFERYERSAAIRDRLIEARNGRQSTGSLVRQANARMRDADVTAVALTETLFVVIQESATGSSDEPAYQIQLWRVMVLHPVVDPNSNRIPAKQT